MLVSLDTSLLVGDRFVMVKAGKVAVDGGGSVQSFLLISRKAASTPPFTPTFNPFQFESGKSVKAAMKRTNSMLSHTRSHALPCLVPFALCLYANSFFH